MCEVYDLLERNGNKVFIDDDVSNARLLSAKQFMKKNISETIDIIEAKFSIKIDISIIETLLGFRINDEYDFNLIFQSTYKGITTKYVDFKNLKFNCQSFPFQLDNGKDSFFEFIFDDNINIINVVYTSTFKDMALSKIKRIILKFDSSLNLINYNYCFLDMKNKNEVKNIKDDSMLLPIEEELLLWQLFNTRSSDIVNLLPEYYIPSAYDFNTEEFTDRLKILSMVLL